MRLIWPCPISAFNCSIWIICSCMCALIFNAVMGSLERSNVPGLVFLRSAVMKARCWVLDADSGEDVILAVPESRLCGAWGQKAWGLKDCSAKFASGTMSVLHGIRTACN